MYEASAWHGVFQRNNASCPSLPRATCQRQNQQDSLSGGMREREATDVKRFKMQDPFFSPWIFGGLQISFVRLFVGCTV